MSVSKAFPHDSAGRHFGWLAFAGVGLSMAMCYFVRLAGLVMPQIDFKFDARIH